LPQLGDDLLGFLQIKGRKIHALVDTQGLPLRIVIHSAGVQDRDGAALALDNLRLGGQRIQRASG
jgi:transposase